MTELQKLPQESKDMTTDNIEKLATIFPNCITEVKDKDGIIKKSINFDTLKQMMSSDLIEDSERYEFTWPGKNAAILEANTPIRKTLRPCVEESKDWENTQNLYIEGDNLDALKLLQESYLGKVKMIYIDPPYNTGNDFIYKDNFAQSENEYDEESGAIDEDGNRMFKNTDSNGRFHSDWCSMIYPRLLLSRNLLSADGVIFLSIDDNELTNLQKICNEIFGEDNFLGVISVVSNPRGRDYGGIAKMHEYLLVYRKTEEAVLSLIEDKDFAFKLFDENGGFELRELRNRNIKFNKENRPNLYYPFYVDPDNPDSNGLHNISLEPNQGWIELYPLESQGINVVWRWGKIKARDNLNINIKAKPMKNGSYMIVEKYRESRVMARSIWWDKESNTEKGTLQVKELFSAKVFDYPKPMEMISRILEMGLSESKDCIFMDFFSGSASSAHALMSLNAKDGGKRKFIMIQIPQQCEENSVAYNEGYQNICKIGEERIRRAGKKIESEASNCVPDVGFRVLKTSDSNMKEIYYNPDALSQDLLSSLESNIKDDRTDLDLLFGTLLDFGLTLDKQIKEEVIDEKKILIYNDDAEEGADLIACFEDDISEDLIKEIAKRKPSKAVFKDSSFANSPVKINLFEIFKLYAEIDANELHSRVKVI